MKSRLLYIAPLLLLFASLSFSLVRPNSVAAVNDNTVNNLVLLADKCQKIHSSKDGLKGGLINEGAKPVLTCNDVQDALKSALGCSGNMFYSPPDPRNKTVKQPITYIHVGDYKDCYNRAQSKFNYLSTSCNYVKQNAGNWDQCESAQNALRDGLGCSGTVFNKADNKGWRQADNNKLNGCKGKIDLVGSKTITIPNADGKGTHQSAPISSSSIQANRTDSGSGSGGGASSANTTNTPDCESSGFSLNWILCSVYNGVSSTAQWFLGSVITPMLKTNPICTSSSDAACGGGTASSAIYQVWSSFRILGNIFLVIALLVIVFGESIGGGVIDAYTAKKVLPRVLLAAVLINLSIYIVAAMVDITNVIGAGIGALITAPLNGAGLFKFSLNGAHGGAISGGTLFTGIAGGLALGVEGIALLMVGLVISGAIAIIGVFFTLVIREALIAALILIAPIAFALWCLPNTEKWFKRWWDMLFQMLLVYPMIVVLFAVADILSVITLSQNKGNVVNDIVSFLLVIIPLFLVPMTLKMSGGLLGQIHGAISGAGKQINAITGRRAVAGAGAKSQENWQRTRNYGRFAGRTGVTRGLNTVLGAGSHPLRDLRGGVGGIKAGRQGSRAAQGAEDFKNNPIAATNAQNDSFLIAAANRKLAVQKLDQAKHSYDEARDRGDDDAMNAHQAEIDARARGIELADRVPGRTRNSAAYRHAAFQQLASTGYQFDSGDAGYKQMYDTAYDIAGGDMGAVGHMMDEAQFHEKQAGRGDLAGINHGSGSDIKTGVRKLGSYARASQGKVATYHGGASAWLGSDTVDASGKTGSANDIFVGMQKSLASGKTTLKDVAEYHSMLSEDHGSATGANRIEIEKQLEAIKGLAGTYEGRDKTEEHDEFIKAVRTPPPRRGPPEGEMRPPDPPATPMGGGS